jgi:hypothetical protein
VVALWTNLVSALIHAPRLVYLLARTLSLNTATVIVSASAILATREKFLFLLIQHEQLGDGFGMAWESFDVALLFLG